MTPLPTPIFIILGPFVAAIITLLLGRWPRVQALVGLLLAAILGIWLARIPLEGTAARQAQSLFAGDSWLLFGWPFILSEGLQSFILMLIGGFGLAFLLSYFLPQGRTFVPAGFAALPPLAAALMIQLFTFGMLFVAIAVCFLAMTYRPAIWRPTTGSLRYLLFFVLAVPLMLIVGWLFDTGQVSPFATEIISLLVIAFAMMLAGFPLYIWVYPLVAEVPVLVPAVILGVAQTAVISFIFTLLQANPWLASDPDFQLFLSLSAIGTVLVAMLMMITAGSWRSFIGYLILLNMGLSILTLVMPQENAAETAILAHLTRFLSLFMLGGAWGLFSRYQGSDALVDSRGLGHQVPFTTALLMVACFSLLGAPLTIGFPALWTMITTFESELNLVLHLLLVLGLVGGAYGILRVMVLLFQERQPVVEIEEPTILKGIIAAVLLITTFLAVYHQPLSDYALRLSQAITG